jgi:N-acetylmuramoyl-L-alanine amidase
LLCILLLLGLFLALGAAVPSAAKRRVRYITGNGIRYLYLMDVASFYGLRYESSTQRFTMRSRFTSLSFAVDETEAIINGTRVHLSDAPWIARGYAVLADVDFRLLLSPILSTASLRRGEVRRVLIDPGHGGKDPGTLGQKSREKDITLLVARRLAKELIAKGYEVALTRTKDVDLSLGARSQKARSWKADITVSLHCNAAGAGVKGIEVFRVPPLGARSTYGMQRATAASPGNAWDADNARLAYEVQRATVAATTASDRGVKNARFMVIKECPCPAVLVEMGFMSYPAEAANLANPAYQAKLARGIAAGISRYDACLPPPR